MAAAGVADRVEIRLQDYRELGSERFDAISSIGMSEHVGRSQLARYFEILHDALEPKGRLLNHAISSVGSSRIRRTSFIGRYVFPDGELIDVGDTVLAMERAGFEVRDVESLREHYARTLRAWVANLEANWDDAVRLAGLARARIWRLYMAGSAVGFTDGGVADPPGARRRPDRATAPAACRRRAPVGRPRPSSPFADPAGDEVGDVLAVAWRVEQVVVAGHGLQALVGRRDRVEEVPGL